MAIKDAELPRMLGRYRLDAVLGRGAMGVVYKAYDPVIDRAAAIKVVHTDLLDGADKASYLSLFRREAQAAGHCVHPGIVTIYDFSDQSDPPFIAMEFVEGENLHAVLRRRSRLPAASAAAIIGQVLHALDYAHGLEVVHRDIKPANIILQPGERVKITDFGVARLGPTTLTQTGAVVGTPSYMSPEQLSGGTVDGRADLFATGAVLYELLTGAKAFPGRDAAEVMAMILHRAPTPPAALGIALGDALGAVLDRALAKDPGQRFQSAREFAHALSAAAGAAMPTTEADATVVAPSAGAPPPSAAAWDPETLRDVEAELARYVGPMARVLVKQAAGAADTLADIYDALAPHIRDAAERTQFLRKARAGRTASSTAASMRQHAPGPPTSASRDSRALTLTSEQIAAAQAALAFYMGPIAKILVAQALAQAASVRDFFDRLATHIAREEDRREFRRKLSADWGPDFVP
jgi:predicted Ser/Thr protein kinase